MLLSEQLLPYKLAKFTLQAYTSCVPNEISFLILYFNWH